MLGLRTLLALAPLAARSIRTTVPVPACPGTLEVRVGEALLSRCGVRPADRLLLCVSGGVDSMAMLHLLVDANRSRQLGLDLRVLHFNHKRREESEEEARFVRGVAEGCGLPFHMRELLGPVQDVNFQAAAREWRRSSSLEVLQGWKSEEGAACEGCSFFIATAHHMDDQVEALFMRLLRGAHISRLHAVMNSTPTPAPPSTPSVDAASLGEPHQATSLNYEAGARRLYA